MDVLIDRNKCNEYDRRNNLRRMIVNLNIAVHRRRHTTVVRADTVVSSIKCVVDIETFAMCFTRTRVC